MASTLILRLLLAGLLLSQVPGARGRSLNLAEDEELQAALGQARASGLPHRMLLADHIDSIIEDRDFEDAAAFKTGVQAVLRHSDFSTDRVLGELYLRMLQQHVKDDILDGFDAAGRIVVDAAAKDWPRASIMTFPKPARKGGKGARDEPLLKAFGAIRGHESLFVIFETSKKTEFSSKDVFTIEISKLSDRFAAPAYRVKVVNRRVRILNHAGDEVAIPLDDPIVLRSKSRTLEMRIPLTNFEDDLRSIAVRGSRTEPKKKQTAQSLWVACPTGPVAQPTEMLIHFAIQRDLPAGNSLPVVIALQEGLLLANSGQDLADRIKKDAYAWLQKALDIDEQLPAQGLRPISTLPVTAQLAWGCRYDGSAGFDTVEQYERQVATPSTIGDLRGYAEVRGWFNDASPADLRDHIAKMIDDDFKIFDFPNKKAREQGEEFEDSRNEAYYAKGKERLLCYRDVGVNQRWKFLEGGFGLKGSERQATEFQRLLSIAVGMPTLRVSHHSPGVQAAYTISFDGRKQKWFGGGVPNITTARKDKLNFVWRKPWTRPERFEFDINLASPPPTGWGRFFLEADHQEFSSRRLESMLGKGFSDDLLAKSILQPLRMRR